MMSRDKQNISDQGVEERVEKEVARRRESGEITNDAPHSYTVEAHYVHVVVGDASFTFSMNEPFGDKAEPEGAEKPTPPAPLTTDQQVELAPTEMVDTALDQEEGEKVAEQIKKAGKRK